MKQAGLKLCGHLQGNLSELLPCIFIHHIGVKLRAFSHDKELKTGIFCMRKSNGYLMNGVILPLSRCRDEGIRSALLQLRTAISSEYVAYGANKRRLQAQNILDSTFGGTIKVADKASLDSLVEFERTRDFFQMLTDNFEYVAEILDNPDGTASPTRFQAFPCKSYGEFLEWYYERMTPDYWRWEHCYPALVFDASGYAGEFLHFPNQLERPRLGLDKFFDIKPGITNQPVSIKLENGGFEWILINLKVGGEQTRIVLSACTHLEHFIELLKSVKRGDVPVELEFDDFDTFHIRLSILSTSDPDRVFLRAVDSCTDDKETVYVEAIVSRHQMVETIRSAMRDFFRSDFDSKAWYGHDPIPEDGHVGEMILADPWFNA